jgi:hypothetical protein
VSAERLDAVTDDDDPFRTALVESLCSFGYRARGFVSPEEFVAADLEAACDCIITDIHMMSPTKAAICVPIATPSIAPAKSLRSVIDEYPPGSRSMLPRSHGSRRAQTARAEVLQIDLRNGRKLARTSCTKSWGCWCGLSAPHHDRPESGA